MADNVIDYRRSSLSKSKLTLPNGASFLVVASAFMAACSNCAVGWGNSRCSPVVSSTGAWIKWASEFWRFFHSWYMSIRYFSVVHVRDQCCWDPHLKYPSLACFEALASPYWGLLLPLPLPRPLPLLLPLPFCGCFSKFPLVDPWLLRHPRHLPLEEPLFPWDGKFACASSMAASPTWHFW